MKIPVLAVIALCASASYGQAIKNAPARFAAYVSSDGTGNPGTWNPLSGSGGTAISFVPQPMGIYYSTDGTGNPGTWAAWNGASTSGVTSIGNSDGTLTISPTSGTVTASLALGHSNIWTANGALSAPAVLYNGTPVTGGTGTTTWPLVLLQPSGTTTTTWNTGGTMFGVNAASGFAGNLFDFQTNGTSRASLSAGGTFNVLTVNGTLYHTSTNCSSAASPAVCGAASAGSVAVPGTTATVTVNTTSVTANSQIMLTQDSSLGTRLSVTCDTTADLPIVTARTAGTSFVITTAATVGANPECISYHIVN